MSSDNFKILLQDNFGNVPKIGDVVKGEVISTDHGEIRLDVAGLTTGVVRGHELFTESSEYSNLKPGEEVEATVIEEENENGEVELSFRVAGFRRAWNSMRDCQKDGKSIRAKVVSANKGGLLMKVEALSGFMPVSQLNPDHYPRVSGGDKNKILDKLQELMGKELEVKVIDINEDEEKLIVSERAVWEDSQKAVLESYKVGDTVDGEVSALTSFGAFMKFGEGLEGLIHISEIAWQRIDHPRDILKVGAKVKAQIIQLDHSKIYLSIKRMVEDPWKLVKDKFKVGDVVKGKVIKIEPFGLMVALDDDIHGLAHISEISSEYAGDLGGRFKTGVEEDFEIVSLEPAEHRLGLKLKEEGTKKKKTEKKVEEKTEEKVVEKPEEEKVVEEKAVEEEKPAK